MGHLVTNRLEHDNIQDSYHRAEENRQPRINPYNQEQNTKCGDRLGNGLQDRNNNALDQAINIIGTIDDKI